MFNPFSLENKTILITGASSGIGRGIAIECSKIGAKLIISGRNPENLDETYNQLIGTGHKKIIADLSKQEDIELLVNECNNLDGVVHSAGIPKLITVKFIDRKNLEEIINTNSIAPILLTSLLIKKKKLNKSSSIIFISSISGVLISTIGESTYSASKGALFGFAKGAALELASQQIRVNCINPGLIETNILKLANNVFSEEQVKEKINLYPMKRMGKPEDVAYGAIYLLSDASTWVTGINLVIDGGFTIA